MKPPNDLANALYPRPGVFDPPHAPNLRCDLSGGDRPEPVCVLGPLAALVAWWCDDMSFESKMGQVT